MATVATLPTGSHDTIASCEHSFAIHLRAENKSPRTLKTYLGAPSVFDQFLEELPDPGRGCRPRVWCSERCRGRHRRRNAGSTRAPVTIAECAPGSTPAQSFC